MIKKEEFHRDLIQSVLADAESRGLMNAQCFFETVCEELTSLGELTNNYTTYSTSSKALQGLVDSAVKLKSAESNALTAIEQLTGTSPSTLTNVETRLENLLNKSGATLADMLQLANILK